VDVQEFSSKFEGAVNEISTVVLGQRSVVEHALIAAISGGHVLIEGVPGLGKTLLVRALSQVLGCSFSRIQFTPDLMPADITGGNVFNQKSGEFEFTPGPVFTQLLLADEVNRAPAKTQAALLEAMQERSVTTDGTTRPLPEPFLVLATQNPLESQGTYPLPEAQLDRFLLKVNVTYPAADIERLLLKAYIEGFEPQALSLRQMLSAGEISSMRSLTCRVAVDDSLVDYITRLVLATRNHKSIDVGASPRASIGLLLTSQTRAAIAGRSFVIPDDVKSLCRAVLRHRIVLYPDAELEGITQDDVIDSILLETSVPGGVS